MSDLPKVSIVIPVKNCKSTIDKCVDSLLGIQYPDYEILFIDDASTDSTEDIIKERMAKDGAGRISLLTGQDGPSVARNQGIAEAKGEYIAFTDGDCVVDREWLKELVKACGEGVAGAGGIQLSPPDDTAFGRSVHDFMAKIGFITGYMQGHAGCEARTVEHNPTCNALYRKDVLQKAGGFLESLWPGEDVELDYRLTKDGNRLTFTPHAVVYHYRPATLGRFRRMMFNYGKAQAFLVSKYGVFRKIQIVPFIIYPAAAVLLLSVFWSPWVIPAALVYAFLMGMAYFGLKGAGLSRAAWYGLLALVTIFDWNRGFGFGLIMKNEKKQDQQ